MKITTALLEEWMRYYYHAVDYDIGSSGVRDLTMAEFRSLCGFSLSELEPMIFHDSECYGGSRLRQALAERWTHADTSRMMVTHGSSEAIYLVMNLAIDPGDVIVAVDPAYQQLYDIAADRGCHVVRWELDPDRGFQPDLTVLRSLVETHKPKMIVTNFPHNPTGVSLTPGQQRDLVRIAADAQAWLVWDHAFGELTYTPALPLPLDYPRTIAFGTFSKSYGLAGLRVGWCSAPAALLAEMAELRDYIALYVSPILEFFAEQAVRHADRVVSLQQSHAKRNLDVLRSWADDHRETVRMTQPAGGVVSFVRLLRHADATAVCTELAERDRVLLVPGGCFGERYRSFVRLGFGGTMSELNAGLRALSAYL